MAHHRLQQYQVTLLVLDDHVEQEFDIRVITAAGVPTKYVAFGQVRQRFRQGTAVGVDGLA